MSTETERMLSYFDPCFDAAKVKECFSEVLNNEVYAKNVTKLQSLIRRSGGRDLAIKTVENTAAVGFDHLIDKNSLRVYHGWNSCLWCMFLFVLIGVFATLGVFTGLYFTAE